MFLAWVKKLSDRKGDFEIRITCQKCEHGRTAAPEVFARLIGPDGELAVLKARLRCSRCGGKDPDLNVIRRLAERRKK